VSRSITDAEMQEIQPTGMRLHTGAVVLPRPEPAGVAAVDIDDEPLCYEHHRGPSDYWPLMQGWK
jgi:hypothetical protein